MDNSKLAQNTAEPKRSKYGNLVLVSIVLAIGLATLALYMMPQPYSAVSTVSSKEIATYVEWLPSEYEVIEPKTVEPSAREKQRVEAQDKAFMELLETGKFYPEFPWAYCPWNLAPDTKFYGLDSEGNPLVSVSAWGMEPPFPWCDSEDKDWWYIQLTLPNKPEASCYIIDLEP